MGAQPQSQQQGDNSLAALWITVFFVAALAAVIYLFRYQLSWFLIQVKYLEISFVSLFLSDTVPIVKALGGMRPSSINSIEQVGTILTLVGNYIRYPFCAILAILSGVLLFGHPALRFKHIYTMKTLYEQEKYNWPQVMPVEKVNLVKEPIEKGPWAMSLTPMQFAKKYRLLYEEREVGAKPQLGESRGRINVGLMRSEAHQAFALQLGANWQGVERLPMHVKALFAVFACRANRDQENAKFILDNIARSSSSGSLDFSMVEEILNKYKDTVLIKRVIEKHAFVTTVMASMLDLARQDGVLASADFLWLKIVDRPMWFMLNAVGRQTPPTEVAGAFAHWLAEKKLGHRISVPMVEEAVKALEAALKESIYVPDEEQ
ncbi:MAG: type IVB secretion system coupling complex protein DotM/IcmP [Gammaproteobacteria bacterium]|nr:type IVB secretion system coupling complex protein DotM/IcmP [Gammaproteobacteria bacterium]